MKIELKFDRQPTKPLCIDYTYEFDIMEEPVVFWND